MSGDPGRATKMPLERIPPGKLRRLAVPLLAIYLAAWLPFLLVGDPKEMVRLQLAGSTGKAGEILAAWSARETADVSYLLGVDHLHLVAYSLLMALAVIWSGRRLVGRLSRWAQWISWLPLGAAVSDVLENVGLLLMIRGRIGAPIPMLTTSASFAKYSLVLAAVPYIMVGVVARVRGSRGSEG